LRQDYTDWELLIMDGGSDDGTLDMAREAAAKDARIKLFSERDKGVYDAMNKGIAKAGGEWLYFLGSDDLLQDNGVLDVILRSPEAIDADVIYGDVVSDSYTGRYDGVFTFDKLLSRNLSHQAAFYRNIVFRRLGDYNLRYKAYADWDFNIRCFADPTLRIQYVDVIIGRFGADGLSSRHDVLFLKEVLLPARVRLLGQTGLRPLRRIAFYDECWRLLRNAEMRNTSQLRDQLGANIPVPLLDMTARQQRLSPKMLKKGFFSKSFMFFSYVRDLINGTLK
jgi:glycosyltransferase involved in cell wall biosynthesis